MILPVQKIINSSIVKNISNSETYSGGISNAGMMILINSIVYYNEGSSTNGTQINKTNIVESCNIQDGLTGNGIGTKETGFNSNNIDVNPEFYSLTMPAGDSIAFWYHPTNNNHALVPLQSSSCKSKYNLSQTTEPTMYVLYDIRSKGQRGNEYFMGAYERY